MSAGLDFGHRCFGCGKPIEDLQSHIHFDLDDWATRNGMEALGVDIGVAFCDDCTQDSAEGWSAESHIVVPDYPPEPPA